MAAAPTTMTINVDSEPKVLKLRSNRQQLAPENNTAEPAEDSCLVLDLIKLAAATGAASTSANKQGSQKPTNIADAVIMAAESLQDGKKLDVKRGLQHGVSPVQHQAPTRSSVVLPTVHIDSDCDSPIGQGFLVSNGQRRRNCRSGATYRPLQNRSPFQDPVAIHDSVAQKRDPSLLLQGLECGQSGGDLVQVRVAQLARNELWTGAHHRSWKLNIGRMPEEPFARSWVGRNSGLLDGLLCEGLEEQNSGGIRHADQFEKQSLAA